MAARIGGKRVFGLGIAATALFTIITPPLVRASVYILIVLRIVEGICEVKEFFTFFFLFVVFYSYLIDIFLSPSVCSQGVTYPCIHAIWANWAPPLERSKLATLAFSGSFLGTVFAMPVSGMMAEHLGWSSVFYVFGAVGLIWFVAWWILVKDYPADDPRISQAELEYIQNSIGIIANQTVSTKVLSLYSII